MALETAPTLEPHGNNLEGVSEEFTGWIYLAHLSPRRVKVLFVLRKQIG